ncbi:LacI family DNA-binding transcriptional regulator [Brachybacterium sp. DNPG3]
MAVTMSDVAAHAGVAPSTVSYMLSGDRPVSAAARERIQRAMTDLGYRRNAMARSLASRRARVLALHMPDFDVSAGETVFEVVRGAHARAAERGYQLTVWPIASAQAPAGLVDLVAAGHADGVLLVEVGLDDDRVDALVAEGTPVVAVGRTREPGDLSFVDVDFDGAVETAVSTLIAAGHRDIAFLGRSTELEADGYGPAVRTHEAFVRIAAERGIAHREFAVDASPDAGRRLAQELHAAGAGPLPDAVVAMNDLAVIGLVGELRVLGVRLPEEMSVVGVVSSRRNGSMTAPALTGWQAPGEAMGRSAVDALLDRIEEPDRPPTRILVDCGPFEGGSLAPHP